MGIGDRYPIDPSNPLAVLDERLRQIERRLGELEGGSKVAASTVREGTLTFTDSTGLQRVRLGRQPDGSYGLFVQDEQGPRFSADEDGLRFPYLAAPFVDADSDFKLVTSASFVVTHRARLEQITHLGLKVHVIATAAAGTTGEIRIRNETTGAVTDAVAVPDGGQATQDFQWLHDAELSSGPVSIAVQARRLSGTGNVAVFRPEGAWMVSPGICVANGVP